MSNGGGRWVTGVPTATLSTSEEPYIAFDISTVVLYIDYMSIIVKDLAFSYPKASETGVATIFHRMNWSMKEDRIVALVGPSGCGKTTFLKILTGLRAPTAKKTKILVADLGPAEALAHGAVAFLPQDFMPAPWRTTTDNIRFVISLAQPDCPTPRENADELLEKMGLHDHGNKYPKQLSGGLKQRLALGMCLAVRPKYLLLDEPFTSLDARAKDGMYDLLRAVWCGNRIGEKQSRLRQGRFLRGILFVSHNSDEVAALADMVYSFPIKRPVSHLILQSVYSRRNKRKSYGRRGS